MTAAHWQAGPGRADRAAAELSASHGAVTVAVLTQRFDDRAAEAALAGGAPVVQVAFPSQCSNLLVSAGAADSDKIKVPM